MSDTASKSAPYVPHSVTAAEQLADSIVSRVSGASQAHGGHSAQRGDGAVAEYLSGGSSAERAEPAANRAADRPAATSSNPSPRRPQPAPSQLEPTLRQAGLGQDRDGIFRSPMLISGGWQPSELIQAGLRTQQSTDSGSPLWGILQAAKLEQVVTAVEAAIASPPPTADRLADRAASAKAADMPVLQGDSRASSSTSSALPVASLGPESSPEITKSARDASARLLDVLRTHAAVHAAAGAERVSLGDMTLIAFADKNQKMAAHQANSVPHPKEADSPAGNIPNYKIKSNANDTLFLVAKTANQFLDEDGKDEQAADSRFGGS